MTVDDAETLALRALAFVAAADGALQRLLDLSGLDRNDLNSRAGDPVFQSGLLDFLLSDEQLLTEFCEATSIDPEAVHRARYILGGP